MSGKRDRQDVCVIHLNTKKASAPGAAKQMCSLQRLINNSSEYTGQSHPDLMRNNSARRRFGKPLVRMKVPRKDRFVADYFPRCCEFTALGFADLRMTRQSIKFATMLRGTRSQGTTPVDAVENSASQRVSISGEG